MWFVAKKKIPRRRANLTNAKPTQNDPHKLRRLRRPTGPRRAALCYGASDDDEVEAVAILEELSSTARRVLGPNNPITTGIQRSLERAKIPRLVIRT